MDKAALHGQAIVFIHRFGSSLNGYVHFHVCAVAAEFEELPLCDCITLEQPLVVGRFKPNPKSQTGELTVPNPPLALGTRLVWWLTELQRKPPVATVRLLKVQHVAR